MMEAGRFTSSPQGVDDHIVLWCICDRDRLGRSYPDDRASKILGNKSQRKHGPAIANKRDNLWVCRINGNRLVIDVSDITPNTNVHRVFSQEHVYCSCRRTPDDPATKRLDQGAERNEGT